MDFRKHTLLPLDDCLYALQSTIPQLTRSSLHRCLERHGISRLPEVEGDKPRRKKFDSYPIGFFHIDLAEVITAEGKLWTQTPDTFTLNTHPSNAGTKHLVFLRSVATCTHRSRAVLRQLHTSFTNRRITLYDLTESRNFPDRSRSQRSTRSS